MTFDFNPKNRPKEASDEIAEKLYAAAQQRLNAETRSLLMLASGFILGQAYLIRSHEQEKKDGE